MLEQGRAALVEGQRPFERQAAGLELGDRALELGEGVIERQVRRRRVASSVAGMSVVPVTVVLIDALGQPAEPRRDQHTDDDAEERDQRDRDHEHDEILVHPRASSSTVAAISPRASRMRSDARGGASAGSRTIGSVGSAADDRVPALERRARPEHGQRPPTRTRPPIGPPPGGPRHGEAAPPPPTSGAAAPSRDEPRPPASPGRTVGRPARGRRRAEPPG